MLLLVATYCGLRLFLLHRGGVMIITEENVLQELYLSEDMKKIKVKGIISQEEDPWMISEQEYEIDYVNTSEKRFPQLGMCVLVHLSLEKNSENIAHIRKIVPKNVHLEDIQQIKWVGYHYNSDDPYVIKQVEMCS